LSSWAHLGFQFGDPSRRYFCRTGRFAALGAQCGDRRLRLFQLDAKLVFADRWGLYRGWFFAGGAALEALVAFATAERRPGFSAFVVGFTAFFVAAFAMFGQSSI
jgi:hypothetical protein